MLDAIVVGAGPAGAVAALVMARAGARVLILDRASSPREVLCGALLSPGAVQLLDILGIDIRPLSTYAVRGWQIATPSGQVRQCLSGRFQPLAIGRPAFDALLLDAAMAAGARFQPGVRVRGPLVDQTDGRVRGVVAVSAGSELRLAAPMVIAADGRRSRLARQSGLRVPVPDRSRASGMSAADLRGVSGDVEIHVGAGAYCRMTPIAVDRVSIQLVTSAGEGRDAARLMTTFMKSHPSLAGRLGSLPLMGLRGVGGLEVRTRAPGVAGLLLAGDAAGTVSPLTGEGIRLAIRGGQLAAVEALHAVESGEFEGAVARLAAARQQMMSRRRVARLVAGGLRWPVLAEVGAVVARLMPDVMLPLFDDSTSTS
jgi:geranylgeranyl reductase family protein